jgi:very-short-patch-repair endonuclease
MGGPDESLSRLAAGQHGVFTLRQARACGFTDRMTRRRITSGQWIRREARVLSIAGATESWIQRVTVACLAADGVASHETAAQIHGIEHLPRGRVTITIHPGGNRRVAATRVHASNDLADRWLTRSGSVPITIPARTIVDLAAVVGSRQLEHALDHALGRRIVRIGEAVDAFDSLATRGRRGVATLRPILAARAEGHIADTTKLEEMFSQLIRRANLPEPDRQVLLGGERPIGRVDFLYRRFGLVVEVDGRLGHSQLLDFEKDRRRDQQALVAGLRVVRFTYDQLTRHVDEVEDVLRALLHPRHLVADR